MYNILTSHFTDMPQVDIKNPPQRILLIKPSAIGDVVHTLPVLKLLRRRWPAAQIAWLVTPACSGLLEDHPLLNEVMLFDRKRFGQGWKNPKSLLGLGSFAWQLRQRKFDLVLDLQGLFRSGWLAWQSRAPVRVGFSNARELAPLFYTHRINVGDPEQHAIDRYLKLIAAIGCETSPVEFDFNVTDADRAKVAQLIDDDHPYAVLLPGTNWDTKRWPIKQFTALAWALKDRLNLDSVVAGGPQDVALGDQIGCQNLAGKTNLRELVALLERAALVIANDSGPMHIASALGRPLVTVFGPTNPVRTGPYRRMDSVVRLDIPCSPCYSRKCSHQSCLQWLGIESVIQVAQTQMEMAERRDQQRKHVELPAAPPPPQPAVSNPVNDPSSPAFVPEETETTPITIAPAQSPPAKRPRKTSPFHG
ncbi:MAG TPA: lipopolysaccharide heptosyltransferase I [Tepidisphaeraceae bacterium]|jgi:lipopolysaccharide heptosyltransferase I